MAGCGKCGSKLAIIANQVGRRDTCPHCDADLHACVHCRHFDTSVAKQCKEPFAEVPDARDEGNFCEFFQIGEGGLSAGPSKAELFASAEQLFRKR